MKKAFCPYTNKLAHTTRGTTKVFSMMMLKYDFERSEQNPLFNPNICLNGILRIYSQGFISMLEVTSDIIHQSSVKIVKAVPLPMK